VHINQAVARYGHTALDRNDRRLGRRMTRCCVSQRRGWDAASLRGSQ
jgi:hypothetical protein